MNHDIWLSHPYHLIENPICKRCGKVITRELWLEPGFWEGCTGFDPLEIYRELVKP
jgi:hypothetical protein